jgi:N-acetylglucosamine-6-phosphate deacetylase
MKSLFSNALLILAPGDGVTEGSLIVEDGVISGVFPNALSGPSDAFDASDADEVIDCRGDFLAPGLVDIHCHGARGRDAMEATPDVFGEILLHHASHGTTTSLLTTVAATLGEMLSVIGCAEAYSHQVGGCRLAGIHLEGPYFSPVRRGAHREEVLRHPSPAETSLLLEHASIIRRMTLAPELPGSPDLVRELYRRGIALSAGHSDATEEDARAGFEAGITQVTHLHNAMSSLRKSGRRGLAEAALDSSGILCELIADGVHVMPGLLAEAWRVKGWKEVALVSDATAGAGLEEGGVFHLGGLPCHVEDGAAWTGSLEMRRLAGSTKTLFQGVRTMTEQVGVPLEEAVAMASLVPARSLCLGDEIGSLGVGKKADLIRFDREWNLHGVWINGVKAVAA